ncbi:class I SAM-dependent methyltransferase [Haloarchaeobius sp. DFWS5]|uniref:class I SAM-dependent methyltransferase n=1 Tax=Haloarchaeobius sp. DFWS5 TaxID=3446114 RepID=UPI003EBFA9F5
MNVPCVRVERSAGEETRQALAEADCLSEEFEITHEDGWLYIPVTDPAGVPDGFDVVEFDADQRRTPKTPADILGYEPSLERLGDIVIIDEDDMDRARETAEAVMASDLPVKTVVDRASEVKGELRIRDWTVLAGDGTETVHREYGTEFALDIAEVYFSPRLATERHRVTEQVEAGEHFFDMFAGVGPFAIPAAKRGAAVVATDLNERAVEYCRENAARNGVADRVTAIQGDVRELAADYEGWADRVVMNLPHSANEFVDTAVALAGDDCVLHLYDIQHEDDAFGPGERTIRDAAEPEYEVSVETRQTVRSYAPHENNVCLDVRLTRR